MPDPSNSGGAPRSRGRQSREPRQARTAGSWTCSPLPQSGTAQGCIGSVIRGEWQLVEEFVEVESGRGSRGVAVVSSAPHRSRGRQRVAPTRSVAFLSNFSIPVSRFASSTCLRSKAQLEGSPSNRWQASLSLRPVRSGSGPTRPCSFQEEARRLPRPACYRR